jgi:hypothetical protein
MKIKLTSAIIISCIISSAYAGNTRFTTIEEANDNCPAIDKIAFIPGVAAPEPFTKFTYLTASFTAEKNGVVFKNSLIDGFCPTGTLNPHSIKDKKEHDKIIKNGDTPCLIMPIPLVINNVLKKAELVKVEGAYGYKSEKGVLCYYKYKGATMDPGINKPLDGYIKLRSE